ncbi:hypothetical protein EST38_g13796 [Candolleomyces aberdarensis]|uniref:Uncharacterized protein n=1 Tax=Candolleomyces aberdarensis TaxID=2316362 RepID=A0A4Q2CZW4_9AGAR|nr:hypothetical protein EST38_g13796 [Candolleomyces aberdarensis]
MIRVFVQSEIEGEYLVTTLRIYLRLAPSLNIRLGAYSLRSSIQTVVDLAQEHLRGSGADARYAAALALLDLAPQRSPADQLRALWILASPHPLYCAAPVREIIANQITSPSDGTLVVNVSPEHVEPLTISTDPDHDNHPSSIERPAKRPRTNSPPSS